MRSWAPDQNNADTANAITAAPTRASQSNPEDGPSAARPRPPALGGGGVGIGVPDTAAAVDVGVAASLPSVVELASGVDVGSGVLGEVVSDADGGGEVGDAPDAVGVAVEAAAVAVVAGCVVAVDVAEPPAGVVGVAVALPPAGDVAVLWGAVVGVAVDAAVVAVAVFAGCVVAVLWGTVVEVAVGATVVAVDAAVVEVAVGAGVELPTTIVPVTPGSSSERKITVSASLNARVKSAPGCRSSSGRTKPSLNSKTNSWAMESLLIQRTDVPTGICRLDGDALPDVMMMSFVPGSLCPKSGDGTTPTPNAARRRTSGARIRIRIETSHRRKLSRHRSRGHRTNAHTPNG